MRLRCRIGRGTSLQDLPRIDENRRDLSRRSERMRDTFAKVKRTHARNQPAGRLACRGVPLPLMGSV